MYILHKLYSIFVRSCNMNFSKIHFGAKMSPCKLSAQELRWTGISMYRGTIIVALTRVTKNIQDQCLFLKLKRGPSGMFFTSILIKLLPTLMFTQDHQRPVLLRYIYAQKIYFNTECIHVLNKIYIYIYICIYISI